MTAPHPPLWRVDRNAASLWLRGDLGLEEEHAARVQRDRPVFHAELAVARNRAWVPRIEELLRAGTRAFIAVGVGHMVGPGRLGEQLERVGIRLERG